MPELLRQGKTRYLVGHDTLGWHNGKGWTYSLPDALGSVRQTVDATGAVVRAREWTPFGVAVGESTAGLGYTGEWWDADVGLEYLRARWYAVQTGRFTQVDPLRVEHLFAYGTNNPINRVDPTGYFSEEVIKNSLLLGELAGGVWGELGAPVESGFWHPRFSGLLMVLKHAGVGNTLSSGRLTRSND